MSTRTPASTALWGHLLRKDLNIQPPSVVASPPVTPLDKTGTSMRLLLHDTQANFEKFSSKVDNLITGVQATKLEVDAMKKLWDVENDKMQTEISDLGECRSRESTIKRPDHVSHWLNI